MVCDIAMLKPRPTALLSAVVVACSGSATTATLPGDAGTERDAQPAASSASMSPTRSSVFASMPRAAVFLPRKLRPSSRAATTRPRRGSSSPRASSRRRPARATGSRHHVCRRSRTVGRGARTSPRKRRRPASSERARLTSTAPRAIRLRRAARPRRAPCTTAATTRHGTRTAAAALCATRMPTAPRVCSVDTSRTSGTPSRLGRTKLEPGCTRTRRPTGATTTACRTPSR